MLSSQCLLLAIFVHAEEAAVCPGSESLQQVLLLQTELKPFMGKRQDLELVAAPLMQKATATAGSAENTVAPVAETPTYYWPMKDGGLTRNGYSTETVINSLNVAPSWSFVEPFDGIVRSGPLIDDTGDVYISSVGSAISGGGNVYRFDGKTGAKKWATTFNGQIPASPALYNGNIYVLTNDTVLHSLSMATGQEAWSVVTGDTVGGDTASILAGEGVVLFGVSRNADAGTTTGVYNNVIVALDASTGTELWDFVPSVPTYNLILSLANQKVIFADSVGTVYALSVATGSMLWNTSEVNPGESAQFTTGGAVQSADGSTAFTNGIITYLNGTTVGRASAYDTVTGMRLWAQNFQIQTNVAPAVGMINGILTVIIVAGPNPPLPVPGSGYDILPADVIALNAVDGTVLWYYTMPTWSGSASGDSFGNQHICWPDSSSTPTIGGDGTVYVGHEDGYLYAIKDANANGFLDPSEVTAYNTGNAFQGSPAIGLGVLAATPCNGLDVWLSS